MAALTRQQIAEIWSVTYSADKAEWKALPRLPNRSERDAALQVLEDFWQSNVATNKASVQTALGQTVSNELLKALARAWMLKLAERL